MILYILFIISCIILCLLLSSDKKTIENFMQQELLDSKKSIKNNKCSIFDNIKNINYDKILDSNNKNYTFLDDQENKLKCCLVEKIINLDAEKSEFKYNYNKLDGKLCNSELYRLDSNKQLLFDTENYKASDYCSLDNTNLGSCRTNSHECIDFVNKSFCDKYNMVWSKQTCNDPIEYKFNDTITLNIDNTKITPTDNTFKLF
jgi:hypothetical protein